MSEAKIREKVKVPIKGGKYTADFITFHGLVDAGGIRHSGYSFAEQ